VWITGAATDMAFRIVLARVGLVSVVVMIAGIGTRSALLPSSDVRKAPSISGPPLYQAARLPGLAEQTAAPLPAIDARPKRASASTAIALLALPQKRPPDHGTTGLAPLQQPPDPGQAAAAGGSEVLPPAPPAVDAESPPKPERSAAAPRRPKKVRTQPSGQGGMFRTRPPIYTRDVQMSVY
jgi:hypothetical protein